jgi:3alpha(or 20beta)-hydroxysteroid dehydrogenase
MSTRVVVVSGGAGGIGAAVAAALAADGWSVVVADRLGSEASAVADGLEAPAVGVELDVRHPTSWEAAVAVASELGPVAGLVNAAGILGAGGVLDVDLGVFDEVLAVNLKGCLLGLRALVPAMEAAGGGSVVNIGSAVAFSGTPDLVAYGASKWALRGLTRTAAIELGPRRHPCQRRPAGNRRHLAVRRGWARPVGLVRRSARRASGLSGRRRRGRALPHVGRQPALDRRRADGRRRNERPGVPAPTLTDYPRGDEDDGDDDGDDGVMS